MIRISFNKETDILVRLFVNISPQVLKILSISVLVGLICKSFLVKSSNESFSIFGARSASIFMDVAILFEFAVVEWFECDSVVVLDIELLS